MRLHLVHLFVTHLLALVHVLGAEMRSDDGELFAGTLCHVNLLFAFGDLAGSLRAAGDPSDDLKTHYCLG